MPDSSSQLDAFTLMSYNIFLGGAGRIDAITEVIRDCAPDLLGIQEADDEAAVAQLANQLGMDYVYGIANTIHHVAFLSRFPIIRSHNHRHPGIMRKTLLEAHVLLPNAEELMLFVAHLNATATISGERRRVREMEAILDSIGTRKDQPHLLFGDCNAIAPGDTVLFTRLTAHYANRMTMAEIGNERRERRRTIGAWLDRNTRQGLASPETLLPRHLVRRVLEAGYMDCYRHLHPDEPGHTFPSPSPAVRIDYLFAPPIMQGKLLRCDVVDSPASIKASDHRPIIARFKL